MKKHYKLASVAVAIGSFFNTASAQSFFKDLTPGTVSTYIMAQKVISNNKMYFVASVGGGFAKQQLWKTDGTVAGTVLVNDSIIQSNNGNRVELIGEINSTMYYTLTPSPTSGVVELWKTDGTQAGTTKVTNIDFVIGQSAAPSNFTIADNKIFFIHGKDHGTELWVTDGTAAGTMEVIDLAPGTSGPIQSPGVEIKPMIAFKGKVYFSGGTQVGNYELYSSDGTAAGTTLVKDLNTKPNSGGEPANWLISDNELYFTANDNDGSNLWKTDGTTTSKVSSVNNASQPKLYKNNFYFLSGVKLWKSDGTAGGTVQLADSVGTTINGILNDFMFTTYPKFKPVPPYYDYFYWKVDLTTGSKTAVSGKLQGTVTSEILDGKMYSVRLDSGSTSAVGLWVNDGTEEGTKKIFDGTSIGSPIVFNNMLFFNNGDAEHGVELWSMGSSPSSGLMINQIPSAISVYPNPTSGKFTVGHSSDKMMVEVYGINGQQVLQQSGNEIDLSGKPAGLYFIKAIDSDKIYTAKVLLK